MQKADGLGESPVLPPDCSMRPLRQQAVGWPQAPECCCLNRASSQHQPVCDTGPPDQGQGGETEAAQDLRDRQHSRDHPAQLFLPMWKQRPRERSELLSPDDDFMTLL